MWLSGGNDSGAFSDRSEYQATIVGTDRRSDLALLKIDAKNLKPLKFADSEQLQVGEWVLAIGSPFGHYSVTGHCHGWSQYSQ